MNISIREFKECDIAKITNYFLDADESHLVRMGVDKNKLPKRHEWVANLRMELSSPYESKGYHYVVWLLDNQAVGHSNINEIVFGESAKMHLHLWNGTMRKSGLGMKFLQLTIPTYFERFNLKKLICEPYSKNIAPNKTLRKLGFDFVKDHETTPGPINFHQTVSRYELTKDELDKKWQEIIPMK